MINGTQGTTANPVGSYSIAAAAATLGGKGTINLAATSSITVGAGGTLAPGGIGPDVGTLTVNAAVGTTTTAVTLAAGSNFNVFLTHAKSDQLVINNGALNLNGAILNLSQDGSLQGNETFTIIDPTVITGQFAGGTSGTSNGIPYVLNYNMTTSPQTISLSVVPEPASLGLLGLAGLGLLARRRRQIA